MANNRNAQPVSLTSGRLLARNTLLNLLGQGAPLLVALIAIPLLIKGLGTDRFGILTLAWMVIGYFSLFNLGLARSALKVPEALRLETLRALYLLAFSIPVVISSAGLRGVLEALRC